MIPKEFSIAAGLRPFQVLFPRFQGLILRSLLRVRCPVISYSFYYTLLVSCQELLLTEYYDLLDLINLSVRFTTICVSNIRLFTKFERIITIKGSKALAKTVKRLLECEFFLLQNLLVLNVLTNVTIEVWNNKKPRFLTSLHFLIRYAWLKYASVNIFAMRCSNTRA